MAKRPKKQNRQAADVEELQLGPAISRGPANQYGMVHSKGRPNYASYVKMLLDPTISNAVEIIVSGISNSIGKYKHVRTEIQDYINRQFEKIDGDLNGAVRMLCSAYWQGMSIFEICAEVEDNELTLNKLIPLPATNVYCRFSEEGSGYDIENIILNYSSINEVVMPKEKIILVRLDADYEHPYGISRLEAVRSSWERLEELKQNWMNASGRYSSPFMVYHLTNPKQRLDNGAGGTITAYENAKQALSGNGVVKGTICCGDDSIEVIPAEDINASMVTACEYYEKLIYRGLLVPSLLTDSGDVGSYALGKEHTSLFSMVIDQMAKQISEVLLEQLIRPMLTYQFGELDDFGVFEKEEILNQEDENNEPAVSSNIREVEP